jgi:hypothetical protein
MKLKRDVSPKVSRCTCDSDYQDSIHGKDQRVWNSAFGQKTSKPNRYRCTVCGATKEIYS